MKIRVLRTGLNDAFFNMGLDEAVMKLHDGREYDAVLRVYEWKPSAVSIGYFQGIKEEVDLDECEKKRIDVVRRITGGGAVFHEKEVTYSFICKESLLNKNIIDSYMEICRGIINGLNELGIESAFHPINDIIASGKKISGNAQTRKEGKILQHGTVLTGVDADKMFSLLKVSNEKIKDKMIAAVKDRVTSVSGILGREINFPEVEEPLVQGFKQAFDAELIESRPTMQETALAKKTAEEKFKSKEWLFMR